jgi:DNA-binding LacI/PurR family transcriptional regulator
MKAAKKLDYKPNAIARMLITQRSGMVAVIISSISNLIYPELLSRITDQLSSRDVRVLLFTLDEKEQLAELLEQIWTFQVDGVIALTAHFDHEDIARFEEHNIPVVLYNRQVPDHPANTVCVDHEQGLKQFALRHLSRHGIDEVPVSYGDFSYQSGKDCFARWMKDHDAPDAVICSNDTMAIGCIDEARDGQGLKVPEELSVTGFDGIHAAFWTGYDLTTVRQPVNQMAKAAVDILMERVENPTVPPEKRVLAGSLFKGSSARS